ncbi:DUF11 domain-containing protein [Actinomadura soli]|uniref:DUF11 domain-containing protein n=1 Tax=Actinomadura soli TaxID=2508997 RepID=A0A5C4JI95_9ACTN|nr:DUF11 domain-containing protein [Actinomadura soli]TMR06463.1 DUF11 domain-containing protein [Actinomadura soli]
MRGLVLLTAAPLLGAVPATAGADADGPPRASQPIRLDGVLNPPPRPRTQAKPKPKAKPKAKAKVVALRTAGPKADVIPGRTYEWKWTFRVAERARPKTVKAKPGKAKTKAKTKAKSGKLQTSRTRPREAVFWTTLPKTLAFVSGARDCASSGWKVICRLGAVRPGGRVSGVIRAKVAQRAKPGQRISPRGTVAWAGTRVTRSFPAVRVAATADLAITGITPTRARAGAKIPYRLKVRNSGPSTAENVMILSEGPFRLVGRNTACLPARGAYVCSVGALRAGESKTLRITAAPRRSVRAGTVLKSSWTVASPTTDLDRTDNGAVARTRITRRR